MGSSCAQRTMPYSTPASSPSGSTGGCAATLDGAAVTRGTTPTIKLSRRWMVAASGRHKTRACVPRTKPLSTAPATLATTSSRVGASHRALTTAVHVPLPRRLGSGVLRTLVEALAGRAADRSDLLRGYAV